MDIKKVLDKYATGKCQKGAYNQFAAKPTRLVFSVDDVAKFNEIYLACKNSDMHTIQRTKSGGIGKGHKYHNYYAWDLTTSHVGLRLTAIVDGFTYVVTLGAFVSKTHSLQPWKAWDIFSNKCLEYNIDLDKYAISEDEGWEWKKKIPAPYIDTFYNNEILKNCHHIDFHNSYPAGLANTHPEFRNVIEYFYNNRNLHPEYKDVLNIVIGKMQARSNPKWAHLSYDSITDNNSRIEDLAVKLTVTGRKIIGFNTDGIWYQGDIYHGEGEGNSLGQWHNDHINCTFRSKSRGAYEFIENGQYTPVLRGSTKYDAIKPRSEWQWGDIYRTEAEVIEWEFDEEKGVIIKHE